MFTESVMLSNHPILCCPLLLPSIFPSIKGFSKSQFLTSGGQSIGTSASASALPMNIQGWSPLGLTGLISLLSKALKSLLQHHSSKASILPRSAFFMVQPSHRYLATGKTIALTLRPVSYTAITRSAIHHLASRWRCLSGAPGPVQPLQSLSAQALPSGHGSNTRGIRRLDTEPHWITPRPWFGGVSLGCPRDWLLSCGPW